VCLIVVVIVSLCRNSFPIDHQFCCVTRYIVEQAQLPNVKVRKLNYQETVRNNLSVAQKCFSFA